MNYFQVNVNRAIFLSTKIITFRQGASLLCVPSPTVQFSEIQHHLSYLAIQDFLIFLYSKYKLLLAFAAFHLCLPVKKIRRKKQVMMELSQAAHCLCGFDTLQCSKTDIILHTFLFFRHNGVSACTYVITLYHITVHNSDAWHDCHEQEVIWNSHFSCNLVLGDRLICLYFQTAFTNKHQIRKIVLGFGCCHCFPLLQMFVLQCNTFY